jgi:hypothetical protein
MCSGGRRARSHGKQSVLLKNYYDRADGSGRVAFSVLAED